MHSPPTNKRIVISGIGVLCSLGTSPEQVFQSMLANTSGIRPVTHFPTDTLQCHIAGEVDWGTDTLEAFGDLSYDKCAQFAITAAQQALQHSGLSVLQQGTSITGIRAERFGLALGTCNGGILSLEAQWTVTELDTKLTGKYPFYQQSDDVASYLGVRGPVTTINTACAASGNAIGYAYDMIRWGYADAMLAGGSDPLSHTVYAGFNVLRALNPLPSSPFGTNLGLNLGEGAAFVVMETLESALQRGATIYGEVCGYGLSNDAHHETAPHPEGRGIQRAVDMALRQSGVPKDQIEYINAHGTGTKANDQAEIAGLRSVFGAEMSVPISSSKAYFGHNLGAAAAIELVTALYAIHRGYVPGTLRLDALREGCEGARIIGEKMEPRRPQYVLNNNSAFGGHNASLVLRTSPSAEDELESSLEKQHVHHRVAIVGIGAVSNWMTPGNGVLAEMTARRRSESEPFSLKELHPDHYERRMNTLCQSSIGATRLAYEDAGWSEQDLSSGQIGYIYGTARGSTSSIAKFLGSIFEKGAEFASSIYFPHTVINSISGKTAEKLGLTGFSSSLSTGGSDGLTAALYAAGTIRGGLQQRCLIGAGDDHSELSDAIDRAQALHELPYTRTEGSVCLALSELDNAQLSGQRIYAELLGFGTAFGRGQADSPIPSAIALAIEQALAEASLSPNQLDLILLNCPGRANDYILIKQWLSEIYPLNAPLLIDLNIQFGYGPSFSSMLQLAAAAELVSNCSPHTILEQWPELAGRQLRYVLTISATINGSYTAAIVGSVDGQ
ncbi:MAG: beta-ketoacyl-[acyl-carrier-protein] synthase family protein [Candidatus Cohnella colombiensis]|uniref:Beta-ketoacyl-[acyl-carrier-protein] synthase family protein n=1 Tax=Candidatus Cohnella colombiensis TaxID=3121368 RepID=A0AA95JC12_9BACL|nr:MAG: beta-ketoacyl-[acyl-carrier-protein] synthase family protein [Cohnella sp.]